jgi:hypothetical protein
MQSKIPPHSANDNGPLTSGQVKALKIAIAVMGFLIVAALLAIVGRVIYLSSTKRVPSPPAATSGALAPQQRLTLPPGAVVRQISLHGNRLLVHYQSPGGPGATILDLTTGKPLSNISISPGGASNGK